MAQQYATRPFALLFCQLQQAERAARTHRQWRLRRAYAWIVALLVGLLAGSLAFSLNWLTEALQFLKFKAAAQYIGPQRGFFLPWLAYTGLSAAYACVAALGVVLLAPVAAGSGVPQMKAWVNGVAVPGAVSPRTLIVKGGGVVFAIAAGLVAGKEGPYIHSGGIVGALLGSVGSLLVRRWALQKLQHMESGGASTAHAKEAGPPAPATDPTCKTSKPFESSAHTPAASPACQAPCKAMPGWVPALAAMEPREQSDYASVGTSAGVGVAFSAPIAGVCYAAEEGTTVFSVAMLWKAILAAGCGVLMLQILGAAERDSSSSFWSYPLTVPTAYSFSAVNQTWSLFWWYAWELPLLCLLGVAGGALGALWSALTCRLLALRARFVPESRPVLRVVEVVAIAAVTATVWISVSYGSPCAALPPSDVQASLEQAGPAEWLYFESASTLFPQGWCQEGQYATWAQLFFMPIEGAVRALFSVHPPGGAAAEAQDETFLFTITALLLYFAATFAGLLLTYGIAAPTGIFIPTMGIGGTMGRLAGRGVQAVLSAWGFQLQVSLPAWSVVGAVGLLAGNTRLLLTSILIVMETSGCAPVVVPLVLAAVVAKWVADALAQGLYDYQSEKAGYTVIEDEGQLAEDELQCLLGSQAADMMATEPLRTLPECPQVRDIIRLLEISQESCIPVVSCQPTPQAKSADKVDSQAGEDLVQEQQQQQQPQELQLVGVVYRWQLLSLLSHPGLLTLLRPDGSGSSHDRSTGALWPAAGKDLEGGSCGGCDGSVEGMAVQLPGTAVQHLSREQRLVLLGLLEQWPGIITPQQEVDIISSCSPAGAVARGGLAQGESAVAVGINGAIGSQQPAAAIIQQAGSSSASLAAAGGGPSIGSDEWLSQRVDLGPLALRHSFGVTADAPGLQVHQALRHIGQHSVLVHTEPRVLGVVTRKDLRRRLHVN